MLGFWSEAICPSPHLKADGAGEPRLNADRKDSVARVDFVAVVDTAIWLRQCDFLVAVKPRASSACAPIPSFPKQPS
jgi:hypothetical protein